MKFFTIVYEKTAKVVERFGRYHKTLHPGFHFLIPVMDKISYIHSLKEEIITVENQQAITKDNVTVLIGGSLFIQIDDPFKASYNIERPLQAVRLLALTVLRSEIGKMKLDTLFQERAEISKSINLAVNNASNGWGIKCLRYEILQIDPPQEIKNSMQLEAEAERLKRREIVISEGQQISEINQAEGQNISYIKRAEGDAESIEIISKKESEALQQIGNSYKNVKNKNSIQYILLHNYLKNYEQTLKTSNVIIAPESQKNGNGNDLITVAAMLMMNNQNGGKQVNQNIQDYLENYNKNFLNNREKSSQQQIKDNNGDNINLDPVEYQELIKKMQYYDDPLLYSSDDEKKKRKSEEAKNENKKDNLISQF
ncbi:stomatin family protein, putative [Ichthyophthirius multifiliis]|uniref:Stomatin family protein, putative n=1 Tax=Ichthyophthirius multifiliis TaxID=5932 RepID=G0QSG6_ICHMU|nr:stomatin family protein, putative [Ichthyophthirius multifiliis]EGR31845.1 stomatin family protein, putative [Ichthyophthirius multifiliis]|eukprot:XP_004035331.1 stomatin family protein, putative [Ichthyophthirius multifiliis]